MPELEGSILRVGNGDILNRLTKATKYVPVLTFTVPVENGSFRLRGVDPTHVHPSQQALFDEMTSFPFGKHDDLLDAAATGTAYLLDRSEPRVFCL